MIPRTAKLRQQQATQRRARMEESAAQANADDPFARFNRNIRVGAQQAQQSRFATTNRRPMRDPNRGVITRDEWDAVVGEHESSGARFRNLFFVAVGVAVLFLLWTKYDAEVNLELPQIESGKEFGDIDSPELRRERYRMRQEIKRAYQEHQENQGQLVHCGRSCEAKNMQMDLAYTSLTSQVDRELYGVLLDSKEAKSRRSANAQDLKAAYEEKKAQIEQSDVDEEGRSMALEELKDAYDILVNPEARKYYHLYGVKPPPSLKHVSARHGGWGQEVVLGTFKYRIILAWLDFLHDRLGNWGETIIILCAILFFLSRIPNALKQSQRLLDELDWEQAGVDQANQQ